MYTILIFDSLTIDNILNIIVLLILAGVTIASLTGNNSILGQATNAKEETIIGKEKEQVEIAYVSAAVNKLGEDITATDLQKELDKVAETKVYENSDGTLNVNFKDTNHNYNVNNGKVAKDDTWVNWEEILADANENSEKYLAKAEELGQNITENQDIGIAEDGSVVNLSLWYYLLNSDGESFKLGEIGRSVKNGYIGEIVSGKIIGKVPMYIKKSGSAFYPVTTLEGTFRGSTMAEAPEIPSSVTKLDQAFKSCGQLESAPLIPRGVTNLNAAFVDCTSLTTVPMIPGDVTNMGETFSGCTSLTTAPLIPEGVTDMSFTFKDCTSLTTVPIIPGGVTNMRGTFSGCTKLTTVPKIPSSVMELGGSFGNYGTFCKCISLTGILEIDANLTVYSNCLKEASTEDGCNLVLKGKSTLLDKILNKKSTSSNITIEM